MNQKSELAERQADRHVAMLHKLAMLAAPLAAASTVDEAKAVADTAKAIELWARRKKAGKPFLIQAMEYQRRAQRLIGRMIDQQYGSHGGDRRSSGIVPLETLGVDKDDSRRCRAIAKASDDQFERWLTECRESEDEPTQAVAIRLHLGAHVGNNSGNSEWYTPQAYVDAVREAMGGIDTDPCSCQAANGVVKAETFYEEADNGLGREWIGRVFVNPPYGDGTVDSFASKLLAVIAAGRTTQAVFLVNNCTETKWFQSLISRASAVCFPCGRISFWSLEQKSKSPLQGQAVMYFGSDSKRFKRAFSGIGFCTLIR
jgi:hypothetical protein